ncbi:MAG TPA: MerR family transcriptional regulator [Pyrinomonadaceae bacterium]|nr:MerR family transcriptional regulator [Pyrinomonadaceae bacterium]
MIELLEAARRRRFVGVAELAQEAARVLARAAYTQERGTVSDVPDERTVRYYLSEGLLSPAAEKQGTASVFVYRHLLQLLAVKKLQAEHLPIRVIREMVSGRSERQLERLLGGEADRKRTAGAGNEALQYLESLLADAAPPAPAAPPAQTRPSRAAPSAAAPPPPPAPSRHAGGDTWARVEIEPGLEVHIRDSYRLPADESGMRRVVQLFLDAVRGGGAGGRGK